jgi:2-amino-4-hydroxy-6-hydroxymethyldihydropteridine diphosphokinase
MAIVYLGIGSNVGDREANVKKAMGLLRENEDIEVVSVSSLLETEPEGVCLPQGKFLNGTIQIKTDLMPLELLSQLKMIERRLGRVKGEPNPPRPMDLDILFYDDIVIAEGKNLKIPHPRLAQRKFVLEPLSQIAPDLVHPRLKKTVRELYEALSCQP